LKFKEEHQAAQLEAEKAQSAAGQLTAR